MTGCSDKVEREYNDDGTLHAEYQTTDGLRNGIGRLYDNEGHLISTDNWVKGKCEGVTWVFNSKGDTILKGYTHDGKMFGPSWNYAANKNLKYSGDQWDGHLTGWLNSYDTSTGVIIYKKLVYDKRTYKEIFDVPTNTKDFYFDVILPDTLPAESNSSFKLRLHNLNENRKVCYFISQKPEINLDPDADSTWTTLDGEENSLTLKTGVKGYNRLLGVIQVDELMGDTLLHFKYPVVDVYYAK